MRGPQRSVPTRCCPQLFAYVQAPKTRIFPTIYRLCPMPDARRFVSAGNSHGCRVRQRCNEGNCESRPRRFEASPNAGRASVKFSLHFESESGMHPTRRHAATQKSAGRHILRAVSPGLARTTRLAGTDDRSGGSPFWATFVR
jgi:hypothetical protein